MKIIVSILRFFFYLLYHPLAFLYDGIAGAVSFGEWNNWVKTILADVHGLRVLELGFGPGHMQIELIQQGYQAYGLDESLPMCRLAKRRIDKNFRGAYPGSLTRGVAERLPYPAGSFDTVLATFPPEFIFKPETLEEIRRTLAEDGVLLILLGVRIGGKRTGKRMLRTLYWITHQSQAEMALPELIEERFSRAGLWVEMNARDYGEDTLYYLRAKTAEG